MATEQALKKPDAALSFFEFSAHSPRQPLYGRGGHLGEAQSYTSRINQWRATSLFVVRQLSSAEVQRLKLAERDDVFNIRDELAKLERRRT